MPQHTVLRPLPRFGWAGRLRQAVVDLKMLQLCYFCDAIGPLQLMPR